jgi:hypothetical protein
MDWMFGGLFGVFMLLWILGLAVMIWALVDAVKVPDDSMYQSGNKLVWVLVIVLLNWIGAIIYFAVGRPKPGTTPRTPPGLPRTQEAPGSAEARGPAGTGGPPPMPPPPPGP